ncbi:facilitated trehalose transporter Tret1-2 homolog [Euwallacea fornicatus]|uniref:facilitated trehalose transporter Tret1-2 homolog n=1 Tax=Euwallacea fornicatus TaxID=995702 RepID=UPI00338FFDB0
MSATQTSGTQTSKNPDFKYQEVAKSEDEARAGADGQVQINIKQIDEKRHSRTFLYIAACIGNLASFSCGITLGWSSPVIPKLQNLELSPLTKVITHSDAGWIGSLLPLGAALGPFVAGALSDRIGRKKTLLIGNIPLIVAMLLNIVAKDVSYLLISRFICGVSVGLDFTVLPIYIGEIAEDEIRGALGTYLQLFTVVGMLYSFVTGPYMSVTMFNASCLIVPSIFLLTFYLFVPESPYYLLQIGEDEAAEKALMKLRNTVSPDDVQVELSNMKKAVDEALANKSRFLDIFKSRGLTKAYVLTNGLMVFQQMSGINVVLFFAQNIFQDSGVTLAPEICTIIIGAVQVLFSAVTSILIDKYGKRILLMISAIVMAASQGALGYFFHLKDDIHKDVSSLSWLPIACLIIFIIVYCLGFGPIPWAVMGEMFPANIKSVASTFTSATCWFLAFILTKYFGMVADLIGKSGSFGLFGACCVVAFVFVFKFLPETKGKSLQEIQNLLNRRHSKV